MASFSDTIKLTIDVITGQSGKSPFKGIRDDINEAEGSFGKLKAAGAGAFDFIKQNAAGFALGAGTALAGFAVKAVGDFEAVALKAGEVSDALGITTEDASALNEVAEDLGIGIDGVESAIGRMNKTAELSPAKFQAIGAEIARNKDGTIDVISTFENVATALDNIPDAGKRAKAAADIFGKGWMSMAELIKQGGDGIRDSLKSVEKAKIVSPEQVAQARKFRDTLDELKGVGESAAIMLGGRVVTALDELISKAKEVGGAVKEAADRIDSSIPESAKNAGFSLEHLADGPAEIKRQFEYNFGVIKDFITGASDEIDVSVGDLGTTTDDVNKRFQDLIIQSANAAREVPKAFDDGTTSAERMRKQIKRVEDQWDQLTGALSDKDAFLNLEDQFDDLRVKGKDAMDAAAKGAEDAESKSRDYQHALIDAQNQVIDLGRQIGLSIPETKHLQLLIDRGAIDQVEQELRILARNRTMQLSIITSGGSAIPSQSAIRTGLAARASGGPVTAGVPYRVGEEGEEVFVPAQSGTIIPNGPTGYGSPLGAGVQNLYLNVNVAAGTNPVEAGRQIYNMLLPHLRTGGAAQFKRELGL